MEQEIQAQQKKLSQGDEPKADEPPLQHAEFLSTPTDKDFICYIHVIDEDAKTIERWMYRSLSDYAFKEVSKYIKPMPGNIILIPKKWAEYKTIGSSKRALPCAYNATESYCKTMFGFNLTSEDKDFFIAHPLVEEDGLPAYSTLRVIQEVISVYGLRIARVRLSPGTVLKGDLAEWPKYLGMNPLGAANKHTDNREFADKMGMSIGAALNAYRMEYSDEAFRPSISCGVLAGGYGSGVTGVTGGHAQFLAPRGKPASVEMSIQLSRVSEDPWPNGEPVYETKLWESQNIKVLDPWRTFEEVKKKLKPESSYTPQSQYINPLLPTVNNLTGARMCQVCRIMNTTNQIGSFRVCEVCWYSLWFGTTCPHRVGAVDCGHSFSDLPPKHDYISTYSVLVSATCPVCKKGVQLDPSVSHTKDKLLAFMVLIDMRTKNAPGEALSAWDDTVETAIGRRPAMIGNWDGMHGNTRPTARTVLSGALAAREATKKMNGGKDTPADPAAAEEDPWCWPDNMGL